MISDVPKKTATPKNETNEYLPNDSGQYLAQWLKESARRTRRPSSSDLQPGTPATPIAQQSTLRSVLDRAKWPLIAALIAIAYLQYFYVGVMVQIASLPAIIFFILINGQMPPV